MPLIKPDATTMAFLQSRLAALGSLHRDIAALTETTNLADLLSMSECVNERLRELHPIVVTACNRKQPCSQSAQFSARINCD